MWLVTFRPKAVTGRGSKAAVRGRIDDKARGSRPGQAIGYQWQQVPDLGRGTFMRLPSVEDGASDFQPDGGEDPCRDPVEQGTTTGIRGTPCGPAISGSPEDKGAFPRAYPDQGPGAPSPLPLRNNVLCDTGPPECNLASQAQGHGLEPTPSTNVLARIWPKPARLDKFPTMVSSGFASLVILQRLGAEGTVRRAREGLNPIVNASSHRCWLGRGSAPGEGVRDWAVRRRIVGWRSRTASSLRPAVRVLPAGAKEFP